MTEATRRHYLEQAVARAHWRVVRAALKRESGPPRRRPVNIGVDRGVDGENRAIGPTEEKAKNIS